MKLFDEVAIVTDERMVEHADALRRMLESFRLNVRFHRIVQRDQAIAFFANGVSTDWTVLMSHGASTDASVALRFAVIGNDSGNPQAVEGWYPTIVDLTRESIPQLVKSARGTVISTACGGGSAALAEAFLDAGCDAYVGCQTPGYVDGNAMVLFVTGLFYFLLAGDRDLAPRSYSLEEAVRKASEIDPGWPFGTEGFTCFTRQSTQHDDRTA